MHNLRKYIRVVSAFLLINFLFSTFLPTISYALTSGPTAPEATSFEPIDTTDMVNLQTGDFTYNIPLLEVPGPSGGYPLSLSYHAGIQPNEEASWVGLGWTLNPGAINRMVNGFADDHQNEMVSDRFFWEGGERKSHSLQSLGISGFNVGLQISNDTYQGVGYGGQISTYFGRGFGGMVGFHSKSGFYGTAAYSNGRFDAGIGISKNGVNIYSNISFMGSSISSSSNSPRPSLSLGIGARRLSNSNRRINDWYNYQVPIGVGPITYRYEYQRYFINEMELNFTYGALSNPRIIDGFPNYVTDEWVEGRTFDNSNLFDIDAHIDEDDLPASRLGGTVPDFDDYSVLGQGIGGSIKPHLYQSYLINNAKKEGGIYETKNYLVGTDQIKPSFRFTNDFSNRYTYDPSEFNENTQSWSGPLGFDFSWEGDPQVGDGVLTGIIEGKVAGSRNVDYLTNDQIHQIKEGLLANTYGFMETQSSGFTFRTEEKYDPSTGQTYVPGQTDSQIGSFIVTNESGVKYHYSLPVYNRNEYYFNESLENTENGQVYDEFKKPNQYAYTWLLTAITGPDFVDRGGESGQANGLFDEDDWGYWVEFDYGKWTDEYRWRNPDNGLKPDIDEKYQYFVEGTKELYYLDAVKTKTHTALFVKEVRKDSKSVINVQRNKAWFDDDVSNVIDFKDDIPAWKEDLLDEGRSSGFIPKTLQNRYYHAFNENTTATIQYIAKPVSTLKLNKVVLLANDEVVYDKSAGDAGEQDIKYTVHENFGNKNYTKTIKQHLPKNVIDMGDFSQDETFSEALRIIEFETDYSLQQGVPNSFDGSQLGQDNPPTVASAYQKEGKLTLGSVRFVGRSNDRSVPPIKFNYSLNPDYLEDAYDRWGYYKSDYNPENKGKVDHRETTVISAQNVHAWSLSDIQSSTGATIKLTYESDSYANSVLNENYGFHVKQITFQAPNITKLTLLDNDFFQNLPSVSDVGVFMGYREVTSTIGEGCESQSASYSTDMRTFTQHIENATISNGVITLVDDELYETATFDEYDGDIGQGDCDDFQSHQIVACNVSLTNVEKLGGGIRVKKIETIQPINQRISINSYSYENEQISSGVTSSEPQFFNYLHTLFGGAENERQYKFKLIGRLSKLFSLSRFAPAPGVMYETVTQKISNSVNKQETEVPSSMTYTFEVFQDNMLGVSIASDFEENSDVDREFNGTPFSRIKHRSLAIKNYTSGIGDLKKLTVKDYTGTKISEETNHYLREENLSETFTAYTEGFEQRLNSRFTDQGLIEQTFADARFVRQTSGKNHLLGVVTKLEEFPAVLTGKTNINYKTGITTTTENLAFDFYSGAVTKTRSTDGYGNTFVSETTPAYRKYGGEGGMGLAINGGKNMLTQTTANYTWKVNPSDIEDKQALVAADIQTWNNQWAYRGPNGAEVNTASSDSDPVWRKHKAYTYTANALNTRVDADGLVAFNPTTFDDFESWKPTDPSPEEEWQKTSEITLYDRYSHALEATDINGHFAATKTDSKQEKVLSTVANASYNELAYSGAEDALSGSYFGGSVSKGDATHFTAPALGHASVHTGYSSLSASSGTKAFSFEATATADRKMKVSVWSNKNDGLLKFKKNGGAETPFPNIVERRTGANGWYLLTATVAVNDGDKLEAWCESGSDGTYFDDFRMHPIDAPMTAYVYNAYDELAFVLDNNNLFTEYEYDDMGRLASTYRESFKYGRKKVSSYSVHYSNEPNSNK